MLPLVRRTFGTFSPPERRLIAERLRPPLRDDSAAEIGYDVALAAPALARVDAILGSRLGAGSAP